MLATLLVPTEYLMQNAKCRMQKQVMFTMMGAAEKAGSGIDKIKRGWSSQHWRFPIVRESTQPNRVMWILPMVSLIPEEALARLKLRFGSKFQNFTPLEVQALVTADLEGGVDNARMRQITSAHSADVTKLLQKLVSKGILVQERRGRWSRYQLCSEASSLHREGKSVHIDPKSVDKKEVSDNEWDELVKIAGNARSNRRFSYKEMETILLNLCQDHWLSRDQLADLLGRNPDSLRYRFLTPMVENGLLSLRYPDKPNHVAQAYTSNMNEH